MAIKLRSNADGTASILNGTTEAIAIGTNGEVDLPVKGSAKAWCSFNANVALVLYYAYNVSSVTDNGIGNYTVNFTTALDSNEYVEIVSGGNPGDYSNLRSAVSCTPTTQKTTTSCEVRTSYEYTPASRDADIVDVLVLQ